MKLEQFVLHSIHSKNKVLNVFVINIITDTFHIKVKKKDAKRDWFGKETNY